MANIIACRISSYRPFESIAYGHLASVGIRHVEILAPGPREIGAARDELRRHGLSVSSMHGKLDLSRDDVAAQIDDQAPVFAALNCHRFFVSVKADSVGVPDAVKRLRFAGEAAAVHDLTLMIETHPDLATNADIALETMRLVDHPNVRINFDPANLYFYNENIAAVGELARIAPYVAAVHLKDTNGGFREWHFPALGAGVVDFPGLFATLDSIGYEGPYTLEIEGVEGEQKTEALVCERIAQSLEYLKQLDRF